VSNADVVIIGGGAAGIAAARRLHDEGVDALLVEARTRLGGRAWTIVDDGGFPLDLGCGWLHSADQNPWVAIAEAQGRKVDRARPPWERPYAQTKLSEGAPAFLSAMRRFRERAGALAENEPDRAAVEYLEPGNRWNPMIDAVSTWYSGAELDRVSARDLERYVDTGVNWRVVEGYGSVVATHGADLRVELDCKVERVDHRGRELRVETSRGAVTAQAVVVTLPSALIAEEEDFFLPALPEKTGAAAGLPLGLADKLFLALSGQEAFEPDSRAFGAIDRTATGAYQFRPLGRPLIECYFGGALAAELERGGEAAFLDFAVAELVGLFGADFARRVAPRGSYSWGVNPLSRGSYSYALPGRADDRATLAAPVDDRIFFAGEACSRTDFSTAHGAFRTGDAAAEQAIEALRRARPGAAGRRAL
jgi:monoamine oxidase